MAKKSHGQINNRDGHKTKSARKRGAQIENETRKQARDSERPQEKQKPGADTDEVQHKTRKRLESARSLHQHARPKETEGATKAPPPALIFLPGMSTKPYNTTTRFAGVLARDLSRGAGTFRVRSLDSDSDALTDGRRIVSGEHEPIVDLWTVSYRDQLPKPTKPREIGESEADREVSGSRVLRLVKWVWRQFKYFLRGLILLVGARARAKSFVARAQFMVGFVAVGILGLACVITAVSVLSAIGVIDLPKVKGSFEDALAIGFTAFTTWLLVHSTPTVTKASALIQQMLDYAENQQDAVKVANLVGDGLDALLEEHSGRPILIVGYSFGALVALDYLFPRSTQLENVDTHHQSAVQALVTIGSPLDFVRLFKEKYTEGRSPRVADLTWINVFNAADVLGSNMRDGDDLSEGLEQVIAFAEIKPDVNLRYTDETLSWAGVLKRDGFFSHGTYWSKPGDANCLGVVSAAIDEVSRDALIQA